MAPTFHHLTGHHVTLTPLALRRRPGTGFARRRATAQRSGGRSCADTSEDMEVASSTARRARSTLRGALRHSTQRHVRDHRHDEVPHVAVVLSRASSPTPRRSAARSSPPRPSERPQYRGEVAHDDPRLRRVGCATARSQTDERNERSRRAIERIGGRFEGVLRNWQAAQVNGEEGATRNSVMYSILPRNGPTYELDWKSDSALT